MPPPSWPVLPHGEDRADPEGEAGQLAEQAQCYQDLATCTKAMREQVQAAPGEAQPALGGLQEQGQGPRSAWRVIGSIQQKTDVSDKTWELVKDCCSWLRTTGRECSLN